MKDIKNYEGLYAITSCGKVWSYKRNKFLKPYSSGGSYYKVRLSKNGTSKQFYIHRLVGEAYLPNPDNLPQIDHIDRNRTNNALPNLRWVSGKDNCKNMTNYKRNGKPVRVRCVETGEVYESQAKAALACFVHKYCISSCITGRQKTAGGYHWEVVK